MGEYLSPPSIVDTIRELDERIADVVIGPAPAWQTPTLENAWANYGGGYEAASYLRDMVGVVRLKGVIKSGTLGKKAFLLPAGYRPGATGNYVTWSAGAAGVLTINSAGEVTPATGSAADFSLSGIVFLAER